MLLKDIAIITMGQSPSSDTYNKEKLGLPFFQGNADFGEFSPNKRIWCSKPKKTANKNDILISVRAPIGALNIADCKCCIGRGLAAITIKSKNFSLEYIFSLLLSLNKYLNNLGTGSTFKAINKQVLENISIPEISINEQKKFVNQINLINKIIRQKNQQLEKLDLLIKARFSEMFGNPLQEKNDYKSFRLFDVGEIISGATPKTKVIENWGGNNLWITPAELNDNSFYVYDTERKITDKGVKSCAVNKLPVGSVLLSSRAPIGKVAIVGKSLYTNQGFKSIIPNEKVDSVYLYFALKINTALLISLGRGATFKEISKSIVGNLNIKVPPIELQNEFAEFVEKVEAIKKDVQKSLDKTQMLFDSLMQQYFG